MQHKWLLDPRAFSLACGTTRTRGSLRSIATFSPHAFHSGAFSENNDDFSDEENYVPPSDSDDSVSTQASDEDDCGGDSSSVDTQRNSVPPCGESFSFWLLEVSIVNSFILRHKQLQNHDEKEQ